MPSKYDKLRDTLITSIAQVQSGAMSPEKASSISKLASQVTASLEAELKVMVAAKIAPLAATLVPSEEPVHEGRQGTITNVALGVLTHTMR